ncbi:MAG: DUF47 family protein [Pyrinomonadaceae bacterium]
MAFSLLPREDDYFVFFSQMTEQIALAANALVVMLNDDPTNFAVHIKHIKELEHGCDEINHKITLKLNKSFITPFDREDIYTLAVGLDDICDFIDAAARAVVMYHIREANQYSQQFARVIQSQANEIHAAVSMLKKPNGMSQHLVEIHRLENEGDEIYFRAVSELFQNEKDALQLVKWKELYEILENGIDRCESVGNIIESIILKHT